MSTDGESPPQPGDPQGAQTGAAEGKANEPPEDAVKAVVAGYYTRGLGAVDRSRQRAERGYTIASAIAAALVAAGLLTHLEDRPIVVQVLALLGLSLWLATALLFMIAVALKVKVDEPAGFRGAGGLIAGIAQQLRTEKDIIDTRLLRAAIATGLATVVTIAALCYGVAEPSVSSPVKSRVELTAQGNKALTNLCGRPVGVIYATVEPVALKEPVVSLELPAGECGLTSTKAQVPKGEITGAEEVKEYPVFPLG